MPGFGVRFHTYNNLIDFYVKKMFYILDFIYYRAAKIYAHFGLGPIGPKKFYNGATPDCLVSFPIAGITSFIPLNIYRFIFTEILDVKAFVIGALIVFSLYAVLISIVFERRYNRIPFDTLRQEYKSSRIDRIVPNFAIILVPVVLWIVGMFFALYSVFSVFWI